MWVKSGAKLIMQGAVSNPGEFGFFFKLNAKQAKLSGPNPSLFPVSDFSVLYFPITVTQRKTQTQKN